MGLLEISGIVITMLSAVWLGGEIIITCLESMAEAKRLK
jgi:hypothetical protein